MNIIEQIKRRIKIENKILNVGNNNEIITFCFLGEFGYELISWIPYLLFLKDNLSIRIRTIGRPGSSPYYYFSDEHIEINSNYLTNSWGDNSNYKKVAKEYDIKQLVFPSNTYTEIQRINIGSIEWEIKNIHKKIEAINYKKIDLSKITSVLPFITDKKIVVINNKYNVEWGEAPINFFTREELFKLKNLLISKGYFVVYNTFYEKTKDDIYLPLEDQDIFTTEDSFDMRKHYNTCSDQSKKNIAQIFLYNKSEFVIGVQGGNVYIPAICKKNIIMLMKKGDYIDYQEISKLYNVNIDVFYEVEHVILFINSKKRT